MREQRSNCPRTSTQHKSVGSSEPWWRPSTRGAVNEAVRAPQTAQSAGPFAADSPPTRGPSCQVPRVGGDTGDLAKQQGSGTGLSQGLGGVCQDVRPELRDSPKADSRSCFLAIALRTAFRSSDSTRTQDCGVVYVPVSCLRANGANNSAGARRGARLRLWIERIGLTPLHTRTIGGLHWA